MSFGGSVFERDGGLACGLLSELPMAEDVSDAMSLAVAGCEVEVRFRDFSLVRRERFGLADAAVPCACELSICIEGEAAPPAGVWFGSGAPRPCLVTCEESECWPAFPPSFLSL